jgi:hypothetical protein
MRASPQQAANMTVSPTTEIIADIRAGRMVVLVDDEDRENEGDLVLAAEHVTPEAINFMARYGRGLICLTLTQERCRQLNLPPMVSDNKSPHRTAFTVSIEATGPYFPAGGAKRRCAGARRAYRSRLRSGATRATRTSGGDLRDSQGRRHHGAPA